MKPSFIVFSCFLFLISCVPAPTPSPTPTPPSTSTPTQKPFPYAGQSLIDVTYCTTDGKDLLLDLYFPTQGGPWPVVVHVHGGAWMRGDKSEASGLGAALNPEGYVVAAINYRLYPFARFPAYIQDVKCAIRFLRAHAAEYNLDTDHIAAMGASAGGHLVALLGTTDGTSGFDVGEYLDQSSRVQAVIDQSGPSDLSLDFQNSDIAALKIIAFGSKQFAAASPLTWVTVDDSPFMIIHGDKDPVIEVQHAYILNDALKAVGVPVELVIVKNGDHSWTAFDASASPTLAEIWQLELDFLAAHLK